MSVRQTGKAPRGKDATEEVASSIRKNSGSSTGQVSEKPKVELGSPTSSAWSKPRDPLPNRTTSSSSTNGLAKAKAQSKVSANIAALAARNLGGFVPNKIFVGGVPIQSTEEQFKAYFETYGPISKVELHALRGFGYITYESVESVDSCLEKYEAHYLCKKWVEVKRSIPRELIDSYEREQKRLEAEYKAGNEDSTTNVEDERPSIKVETPSNAGSSSPSWGMPPAPAWGANAPGPRLPGPGQRRSTGGSEASPENPSSAMVSQISQLKEMGFSEEVAKRALSECVWDVNKAIDKLLSSIGTEEEAPADGGGGSSTSPVEDPVLSPTVGPAASPKSANAERGSPSSPPAKLEKESVPRPKETAWAKPQTAWAKPPENVWGAPKATETAWGKAPTAWAKQETAWGKSPGSNPGTPLAKPAPIGSQTTSEVEKSPSNAANSPSVKSSASLTPKVGPVSKSSAPSTPKAAPSTPKAKTASGPVGGSDGPSSPSRGRVGSRSNATAGGSPLPNVTIGAEVTESPMLLPPAALHAASSNISPPETPPPAPSNTKPSSSTPPPSISPPPPTVERLSAPSENTGADTSVPSSGTPQIGQTTKEVDDNSGEDAIESKPDIAIGAAETVIDTQQEEDGKTASDDLTDNTRAAADEPLEAQKVAPSSVNAQESVGYTEAPQTVQSAPVVAAQQAPPRKRIQRMKRPWSAEDPSQLSASESDFIQVWIDTSTDHGWIHAERLTNVGDISSSSVGWLPMCVLVQLADNRRWMRVKQQWQAIGESQTSVEQGEKVIVWIDSRTEQGWTYVEAPEGSNSAPGWLPDFCLEWNAD